MMITIAYLVSTGPIIIFHLKSHAVKLKCVDYKLFLKKHDFCQKHVFLKLENIHNFGTYFHPLRNNVLKLLMINLKQKHVEF